MNNRIPVPDLSETTLLSRSYLLALGGVMNYLESIEERASSRVRYLAKRTFLHREVPHYDVYFSEGKYLNVVVLENQVAIEQVNNIVDEINSNRSDGNIDYDVIYPLVNQIIQLID
ncbi:MAG: hypothetical protein HOL17_06335 [Gammaproteobacteria bacterium]|jgi:hypothetical protein|nr:hypothetical protein [Gammaproteobacteria bacterium]MBT4605564.1 hypothetical protein [Thiotrichales bacterium]MBT5371325.1 hypothetical protein [Gammaproteobacteria bacterium]MBT7831925.1 hypothetical protein [Candidatus Neomarinimicrobiota bacterium]